MFEPRRVYDFMDCIDITKELQQLPPGESKYLFIMDCVWNNPGVPYKFRCDVFSAKKLSVRHYLYRLVTHPRSEREERYLLNSFSCSSYKGYFICSMEYEDDFKTIPSSSDIYKPYSNLKEYFSRIFRFLLGRKYYAKYYIPFTLFKGDPSKLRNQALKYFEWFKKNIDDTAASSELMVGTSSTGLLIYLVPTKSKLHEEE